MTTESFAIVGKNKRFLVVRLQNPATLVFIGVVISTHLLFKESYQKQMDDRLVQ